MRKYIIVDMDRSEILSPLVSDESDVQEELDKLFSEGNLPDLSTVQVMEIKTVFDVQPEKYKLVKSMDY